MYFGYITTVAFKEKDPEDLDLWSVKLSHYSVLGLFAGDGHV